MRPPAPSHQSGDTLLELLIAVVILSIAVLAIVSGLTTTVTSSASHRSLTALTTLLKTEAEQLTSVIEEQSPPAIWPTGSCATAGTWNSYVTYPAGYPPTSYTVSITDVSYWNNATGTFSSTCTENGIERLTLSARTMPAPNGSVVFDSLQFVVRNPSYVTGYGSLY